MQRLKNRFANVLLALAALATISLAGCGNSSPEGATGFVVVPSQADFTTTSQRLAQALRANANIILIAGFDPFDHAANAKTVDLKLAPTHLFVFGNPKLGTGLMQANPTTALDLPQKILVYEREGKTFVAYNTPEYLAKRHRINGQGDALAKISAALQKLAQQATQGSAAP